jgi:hypothetical protein
MPMLSVFVQIFGHFGGVGEGGGVRGGRRRGNRRGECGTLYHTVDVQCDDGKNL